MALGEMVQLNLGLGAHWHDVFRRPSVADIRAGKKAVEVKPWQALEAFYYINPRKEYVIVDGNIIPNNDEALLRNHLRIKPESWAMLDRNEKASILAKKGPTVQFPRFDSLDEIVTATKKMRKLSSLLREPVQRMEGGIYVGISYAPKRRRSSDDRKRVVPFQAIADGEKLFLFSHRYGPKIKIVKKYDQEGPFGQIGAWAEVSVPYRQDGPQDYSVKIFGIPVVGNQNRFDIGLTLKAEHDCAFYRGRVRMKAGGADHGADWGLWDPHSASAWNALVFSYFNEGNSTPLLMSPIPFTSQAFSTLSENILYNGLIRTKQYPAQAKEGLYPINIVERGILLGQAVMEFWKYGPMLTITPENFLQKQWRLF